MMTALYRYTLTRPERLLLAQALRWAAHIWKYDPLSPHRINTAIWLEFAHLDRLEMEFEKVKDSASCLGYWAACQESAAAKQAGRELLVKLIQPFAKSDTVKRVDRSLALAKDYMKARGV